MMVRLEMGRGRRGWIDLGFWICGLGMNGTELFLGFGCLGLDGNLNYFGGWLMLYLGMARIEILG